MKRVCVFCGANPGSNPAYVEAASALGAGIAERGLELVYGGGSVGMMGVVADAALAAGGRAIGVIPRGLATKELAHQGLTEQHIVANMHERKAMMSELADAFIALPGGFGTLEELFEVTTWAQLGIHRKPVAVLNIAGYYDALVAMIDTARDQEFIGDDYRQLLLDDNDGERLLKRLAEYQSPNLPTWMTFDET
ncbi:MAG: TIGR00730 family Rossman fold protein [Planctomycetota bacterium]